MNCELTPFPPLPGSWSALSWQQLCLVWDVKRRYGGNADVARVAALLMLLGMELEEGVRTDLRTGETIYRLRGTNGAIYATTPRELSYMARHAIQWFDYPYGDPGEDAVKDDKGKVVKEGRDPVRGYVSLMRDAMPAPVETVKVGRRLFALPQVACNNLTWQQYRSLQAISPQLFAEGVSDEQALDLQAQFLAHILTPRTVAIFDTFGGSIRFRPHYDYKYNGGQAEEIAAWIAARMKSDSFLATLFHICFQVYQTALSYYAASYPLLFQDSGKSDPMKDVLTGEVGTINTIMKYAGYSEQQQVYDSNLPFVLDILNTMSKEAKEIEKMNRKIKK